ncbi:MAG TPA: alpha/beta hydrolase [Jatrophihabitantaceae bacterium]|nr:alpha/beta hydrolase [Jatrophihabitantaceae bacterium]
MKDLFAARQLAQLGLTANALRPIPGGPASVPAFFSGWLTAELAPHVLTATVLDAGIHTARHGVRTRDDRIGLAAAGLSAAGLVSLIRAGQRARGEVETALLDALGENYGSELSRPTEPGDLATPWRQLIWPFLMRHVDVERKRRLSYAPGGRRFGLTVYHHKDVPPNAPVLLSVHGGGWTLGTNEWDARPLMLQMAAYGWVCLSVNYPLSPRARWPEHIVALKRAMKWIRENVHEYGGDPSFVAVTGGSAGGHLAAMLALTSDDKSLQPGFEETDTSVQACVPHYGVYDFTAESGMKYTRQRLDALIRPIVMARGAKYPDEFRAASPLYRVDDNKNIPPFFVLHGRNDTLVPVHDARAFVDRLRAVSSEPVAYAEIGGAQHAFDIFPSIRSAHVVRGVQRFLDWTYTRTVSSEEARGSAPLPA